MRYTVFRAQEEFSKMPRSFDVTHAFKEAFPDIEIDRDGLFRSDDEFSQFMHAYVPAHDSCILFAIDNPGFGRDRRYVCDVYGSEEFAHEVRAVVQGLAAEHLMAAHQKKEQESQAFAEKMHSINRSYAGEAARPSRSLWP